MSFHERRKYSSSIGNMASSLNTKFNDQSQVVPINNEQRMSLPIFVSGDFKELDEKVKSLMEKGQTTIPSGKNANGTPKQATSRICKVCGKEGAGIAIRDHIEANHLEGVSLPCNVCGKVFRSRARLRKHICDSNKVIWYAYLHIVAGRECVWGGTNVLLRFVKQILTLIIWYSFLKTFIQDQIFFEATWSTLQRIVYLVTNEIVDNGMNSK